MKICLANRKIYIDEVCIIMLVLCILFPYIRKYFFNYYVCFLFIIFHESSHALMLSIFGISIDAVHIKISGINIDIKEKIKGLKGILVYMAGPLANFILGISFKTIPMVFEINMILGIINLIPIYPLDGYNIFEIIITKMCNRNKTQNILKIFSKIILVMLAIIGIAQLIIFRNPSIILLSIYTYFISFQEYYKNNSEMYQKYYKNITNF